MGAGQAGMGETREDHGAQESLEQYCNNAWVERVMDAIEQGNRDRDHQAEEDYRATLSPRLYEEAHEIEQAEQCQQLDRVVAKDAVENNKGLSDDQHEPDQPDCLRQRHGPGVENQELHREERPNEGDDLPRRKIKGESGSDRERDPQRDAALA